MPSTTVPTFSNRADSSHKIHWDIPLSLSTRPRATVMAASPTASSSHRAIAVALTANISNPFKVVRVVCTPVTRRIWA